MKALIVEDDIPAQKLYGKILKRLGWEIDCFSTAEESLSHVTNETYGIALLDWMLPGMSGLDLCRRMREMEGFRDTVILIITGRNEPDSLHRILESGADDYVPKPATAEVLEVRAIIAGKFHRERTDRTRIENELKNSEQRYALAAAGSNDVLWDWNLETGSIYFSSRWRQLTGIETGPDSNERTAWLDLIHPEDRPRIEQELQDHLKGISPRLECEYRIRHSEDGIWRWILTRGLAVRDENRQALRVAGSHTDLTMLGVHDAVTGLPNRALFVERLKNLFERKRRPGEPDFAILFLDLDRFKIINDSLGHSAGDEVLLQLAHVFRRIVRPGDYVSRFGGDEFAILLEEIDSVDRAREIANRILQETSAPLKVAGREVYTAVSIGVVVSGPDYSNPEDMLRDADIAMYQAKSLGRARVQVFEKSLRTAAEERLRLASDLRRAVSQREFLNYYQPIFTLGSRHIEGFECLARWYHPELGFIPPARFIPLAEELGLIRDLGDWILREAFRQFSEWRARFGDNFGKYLSVNLAARQITHPDFLEYTRSLIEEYKLPPGQICLEVTESAVIDDIERVSEMLRKLQQSGFRIGIDDFGTGYSSLKYLHELPIDVLKIDQSFVSQLGKDWETTEIVRSIIELCGNLDIDVVAEGVANEFQEQALITQGCKLGQGFLFAVALDPKQATLAIERNGYGALPVIGPPDGSGTA